MILIIPALHIAEGRCVRTAEGEAGTEGKYPLDPVAVARLWRGENAKALHIAVKDAAGIAGQRELLRRIVGAVDIPIQLADGIATEEDVRIAIEDVGAFRVVVHASALADEALLPSLLARYGPRKIVIALDVEATAVTKSAAVRDTGVEESVSDASAESVREEAVATASRMKEAGIQRLIVSVIGAEKIDFGPPSDFLLMLAERTNLSVTLNGCVRHYSDLKIIQDLHPRKIDSIILDEALYSNSFPCQKIWRKAERQLIAQQKLL